MMSNKDMKSRRDDGDRSKIQREPGRTILVEAAAGTGKTTAMVDRMIVLLEEGYCRVDTMAAVTFTRKAAAELRSRFLAALEMRVKQVPGAAGERLRTALAGSEGCFIGTIHSFCARLLRERPVEAGVSVDFREIDDQKDEQLRREAWDEYVANLYAGDSEIIGRLEETGLHIGQLKESYMRFAEYPDVQNWPAPAVDMAGLVPSAEALRDYVAHMKKLLPTLPRDPGHDKLMPKYRKLTRMLRQADPDNPRELLEIMEEFGPMTTTKLVQKNWPGGPDQAKIELKRWNCFVDQHAGPLRRTWRELRYHHVIEAIRPAAALYDRLRSERGELNYQDLLMKGAALLRENPDVRQYFRERYTHLLVDEFQDTDPVQAEVMILLTADDPCQTDWRRCRPVPGSLFVVGDPKQSIYRFRRADIVTYNKVKKIIIDSGGLSLTLSTNFRSSAPVVKWVNSVFEDRFPEVATETSPAYVPLLPRDGGRPDDQTEFLRVLSVPEDLTTNERIISWEADFLARHIRKQIDEKIPVAGSLREKNGGTVEAAQPGHFLIVTRNTRHLSSYSRKLQDLKIPHEVTGGSALMQVRELALLHGCLAAVVRPDDPVALAAVLRGELFGISDQALYAFRRAGGRFSFNSEVPRDLGAEDASAIRDAFQKMKKYSLWLSRIPPVPAIEKITADLGLWAMAGADAGGGMQAGSLARGIEILRASQADCWTAADLVGLLGGIIEGTKKYDGLPARPHEAPVTRIMNLHKVKGLEAPVVFLADPSGESDHEVEIHIDRSGEENIGYLAIYEGNAGGHHRKKTLLAHPQNWENWAGKEREFGQSEQLRLLYVAATRAGERLIITTRKKNRKKNPWAHFDDHLIDAGGLPDPGPRRAPAAEKVTVRLRDVDEAAGEIKEKWIEAGSHSYEVTAAKELALAGVRSYPSGTGAEQGTKWGTVIHLLLEKAMNRGHYDIDNLARAALIGQDLDPALTADAVKLVRAVAGSDLWKRARKSRKRFVEVPFWLPASPLEGMAGCPTIIRGVIDLAFWEKNEAAGSADNKEGWVIIDYKTDDRPGRPIDVLAGDYAPQLRLYRDAWEKITGDHVREAAIYFINTDCLVRIS